MKRKNMMIASGVLAAALVISSMSTNYASAGVKNAKVTTVKKKDATKKKTAVVVKTASELNNALKNSANIKISLKSNKKIKLSLKGNHKKVKLVIDAPKAEVTNKGRFKIIEIGSKKWVEKANGNGLVVKSKESSIEVSKNAKVAFIRFLKSGAKADVSIKGEVSDLVVEKKAELSLSGKTELVPVTVNAEGTKVTSSVQVELIANKNTETIFKKGAEGSSVKAANDETKVVVKNETKEEVFVENASGDETVLMSGAYKELKNGVLADKGGYENSLDNTVSLNDETTPLGDGTNINNILQNTVGNVVGQPETNEKKGENNSPVDEKLEPKLEANGKVYRKYDLRELNAVSKIKNQFRDGGCRSFAALGALESHIKLKTGVELDLSENNFENRQGFYFGTNNVRQGRNRNSDLPYLVNYGPILEEDDPYIPMKGEGGEGNYLTQEQVNAAAKNPVLKDGVKQIMGFEFLKNVDTAKVSSAEDDELLQIKEAIAKNGGVVADMYMAHDGNKTFPYTDVKYYNPETKAYYFDGKDSDRTSKYRPVETDGIKYGANHAITIVGWDDDFSKDNFITKPEIDGAWIVRDAQSEAFGDKGYFYVSFQSVSMGENPYVFTEVTEPQYGIYQHDELAFTGYREGINFATDEKDVLFNRYKAVSDSKIDKVGFYTTKKNAEYEVYFIPDFAELEEKAEEIGGDEAKAFYTMIQDYKVLSGTAETAGYHTLDIPAEVDAKIKKGTDFTVGIWTKNSDKEDPKHKYDMVIEEKNVMGQGKNAKVGKEETYIYDKDFGFMDLNQYSTASGPAYPVNACVKAYYKR
ncbi:MAG: hypothetical protein HXK78_06055 [Lachnospiraceae bacterium]|nr:hypothetical protein [Lachnospiraceae bacterium]